MFPSALFPPTLFAPSYWPRPTPAAPPLHRPRTLRPFANIQAPLLSLEARGTLARATTFRIHKGAPQAMKPPTPHLPRTAKERDLATATGYYAMSWITMPTNLRELWTTDSQRGAQPAYRNYIRTQWALAELPPTTRTWRPLPPRNPTQSLPPCLLTPLPPTVSIQPPPPPISPTDPDLQLFVAIVKIHSTATPTSQPALAIELPPTTTIYVYPDPLAPGDYAIRAYYTLRDAPRRYGQFVSDLAYTTL